MTDSERTILDRFGAHVLLDLARAGKDVSLGAIRAALARTGDLREPNAAELATSQRATLQ